MTEASTPINSGDLTLNGNVDWTLPVFENEDKDFKFSCQYKINSKILERQENVEEKEAGQPVFLKDAPHLSREEINNDTSTLLNVLEFEEETVKQCRPPEDVSFPTESGYYSQSNADSLENTLKNDEQFPTCTDDNENNSHATLAVQSTSKSESLMKGIVEDMCKKVKKLGSKMTGKRRKHRKKAKQSKKTRKTEKVVGRKILQLLKPVMSKAISKNQKYAISFQVVVLQKELRKYFKQKGKQLNYSRSKKHLISLMKSLGILDLNPISFKKVWIAFPLTWMFKQDLPENMRIEWLRVYSFASVSFRNVSSVLLAKHGFYFNKDEGKIKCFACDKRYTLEELENTEDCNAKLERILHEDWCLVSDGNVPIHPAPVNSVGISEDLPSCNKRKYLDEVRRVITYVGFCGLNTFFVDQGNMLREFPALIDAYENYNPGDGSINPFKVILDMLRKGERNSARGMRDILLYTKLVTASETTIKQFHFELIKFVFELMKGKIIIKGKCGCPNERMNKEEQIYISECACHKEIRGFVNGIHFFQHWIECRFASRCCICKDQISWTLLGPPPCLFIKLWHLNLRMDDLPKVIHVLGKKYRLGSIYVHANQHFTAWVSRPHGMTLYDDHNVDEHDKYTAKFDDIKEFPGSGKSCLASYFIT